MMGLSESKFCVYAHYRKDNTMFYIGSGTMKRAFSFSVRRGAAWYKVSAEGGVIVKVLFSNLTKQEAISVERALIIENRAILVNKSLPSHILELSRDMFPKDILYDETSCTGLSRNGKPLGWFSERSGYVFRYNKRGYIIPRVIWAIVYGMCPSDKFVDHLDGNNRNNTVSNLRLVSPSENGRNRRPETLLPVGIKEFPRWFIVACPDKTYSVSKEVYGAEFAFLLCCEFRLRLFNQGRLKGVTFRHTGLSGPYLPSISDNELLAKVSHASKIMSRNTSGARGVTLSNKVAWVYSTKDCNQPPVRFSIVKYGNALAKRLCIEYANFMNGTIITPGLSREVISALKDDTTSANTTGTRWVGVTSKNGYTIVTAQRRIPGSKKFVKTVHVNNFHELIGAVKDLGIAAREALNKETI